MTDASTQLLRCFKNTPRTATVPNSNAFELRPFERAISGRAIFERAVSERVIFKRANSRRAGVTVRGLEFWPGKRSGDRTFIQITGPSNWVVPPRKYSPVVHCQPGLSGRETRKASLGSADAIYHPPYRPTQTFCQKCFIIPRPKNHDRYKS